MNTKEEIIKASRDFLALNSTSHLVRWVMVIFLLFCGIPQKTIAAVTNYTDRQIRNIRDQFENSNGDFSREGKKRGAKEEDKKANIRANSEVYRRSPPLDARRRSGIPQGRIQARGVSEDDRARIGGICISDLYRLVREKENRAVHVNYAGGWLLAPFIADMVKKTEQAFGELAGSVEAILTLFFLSVTGLRPVDPENPVRV